MRVEDIMTKEPVACDVQDDLVHAAKLMRDKNVGCLVALENGQVSGILTDRDLALWMAEGRDRGAVHDVMQQDVARLHPQDDLFHAVDVFRSAGVVRRLPVVDERNRLIGILGISDLSVVAEDLLQAVLLEERHETRQPHLLTGAKSAVKRMRRPGKAERMAQRPSEPVSPASTGRPAKTGKGSD